ncbi:MAG: hypothetical protein IBX64_07800 [Actinobacteria bacterium]|nr:hypothetical protein [Actinomycetota bacterium]
MKEKQGLERPTGGIHTWHVKTLVRRAINAKNYDTARTYIAALHWRGTKEVLDAATSLCHSKNPHERSIGADILGQLGVPERTFPNEALRTLHDMPMACRYRQRTNGVKVP